ncbi:hypothetical protein [Parapedobacter indicus]|uniref:hypothetical protein n=1 Tax=Parapedobacter indicus TaxID=1477437 RepID=UPI00116099E1|nr:hypothetical protein [Parapedobacter indicus]
MAKVFVILLTFIYTCSATGATVHLHYCCGELQKFIMEYAPEEPNPDDCPLCLTHHEKEKEAITCCTDDSNDSCTINQAGHGHCQNVKIEAKKTTEEHLPSAYKKLTKIYPLELLVFTLAYVIDLPLNIHDAARAVNHGPPDALIPLFIQHCTYRI